MSNYEKKANLLKTFTDVFGGTLEDRLDSAGLKYFWDEKTFFDEVDAFLRNLAFIETIEDALKGKAKEKDNDVVEVYKGNVKVMLRVNDDNWTMVNNSFETPGEAYDYIDEKVKTTHHTLSDFKIVMELCK